MKLNKAGMMGFFLCFMAIIFGVATNGGLSTIVQYLHLPSFILTVGGALCAVLTTADSFEDFAYGAKGILVAFQNKEEDAGQLTKTILQMSDTARKEGLLALEETTHDLGNPYLEKGIRLVVDGSDPELVRDIMEAELTHTYECNKKRVKFWEDFGAYAPAWGMVGTLIGLINMLKTMGSDSSAIGSGMSLALITTLYGSIIANWICIPIARKLEKSGAAEALSMELVVEGVLSIQAGENSRIIKEKLSAIVENEVMDKAEEAGAMG